MLTRVTGEEGVAEGGRGVAHLAELVEGVEVAQRLAHFFTVYKEVFAVIPVVGEGCAVTALTLGDLVFVMRKEQIHSAGVEINSVAEVFLADAPHLAEHLAENVAAQALALIRAGHYSHVVAPATASDKNVITDCP